MNAELLAGIAGIVISLLFSYFPGLSGWYDPLPADKKRFIMLGALLVSALGVFGLACIGKYDLVSCDLVGAWNMLEYFVLAVIANQASYSLSPRG